MAQVMGNVQELQNYSRIPIIKTKRTQKPKIRSNFMTKYKRNNISINRNNISINRNTTKNNLVITKEDAIKVQINVSWRHQLRSCQVDAAIWLKETYECKKKG